MNGEFDMRTILRFSLVVLVLTGWAATAAAAETIRVTIKGFKFSPADVSAHIGDTIEWTNEDSMPHTATARDKQWDVSIPSGKNASVVVGTAGAVEYFCRIHPSMIGKVNVAGN